MMRRRSVLSLLAALALLVPATVALGAHSVPESWQALTRQVNSGQVASALVVPKKNEVRIRLKDGTHYTAIYPSGTTPASVQANLRAHGATATIHKTAAGSSGHVRYRYIALAILALGALAALGYYLLRGRPAARSEAAAPAAASTDPDVPPSPAAHPSAGGGADRPPPGKHT